MKRMDNNQEGDENHKKWENIAAFGISLSM